MKHTHRLALAGLAAALLAACSSVEIHKVDRTTGAVVAGSAPGFRFYLPRPYVSVYEPFIVASETYLARGELSPDGRHVLLTEVPSGLAQMVSQGLVAGDAPMGNVRISTNGMRFVNHGGDGGDGGDGGPQSAAETAPGATGGASSGDGTSNDPPDDKPTPSGGIMKVKATNDNNAYAVTPQPRYFNILWLPDFDEQYVVTARPGLGNADVDIAFGQGWSLQGIESTVDNSALMGPLLDFYGKTLSALQKVATAKIEAPLALLAGEPQSGGMPRSSADPGVAFAGGTPVSLKVTKVRIAAPGLYPILKPSELSPAPGLTPAESARILAPVRPFTNIAFNTYDVIVIEAAKASGDSALRIQQYVDSSQSRIEHDAPEEENAQRGSSLLPAQAALRKELSTPANTTTGSEYFTATVSRDNGVTKVELTKQRAGTPGTLSALPDDATLKAKVISILGASGVIVVESNIRITRS